MADYSDTTRVEFQDLPIFLSASAYGECLHWRMSIYDVVAVLQEGKDCSECPRKVDVVERSATFRHKWMKVVAVADYHYDTREDCWLITHVGEAPRQ
jgi:hypothetical protein